MKTKIVTFPEGYQAEVCVYCETAREEGGVACCDASERDAYRQTLVDISRIASPSGGEKELREIKTLAISVLDYPT